MQHRGVARSVVLLVAVLAAAAVALSRSGAEPPGDVQARPASARAAVEAERPELLTAPADEAPRVRASEGVDVQTAIRGPEPEQALDDDEPPMEELPWDDAEWLARVGLPADTPLAPDLGLGGPPDPLEQGSASLTLELVERGSGEAVAMHVVLWRLDAPANRIWTAGDQPVARARVGADGHVFERLASGRYRVFVEDEAAAASEHEPLDVRGFERATVEVESPRDRPVRLVLVGADGAALSGSPLLEAWFDPVEVRTRHGELPPWVRRRSLVQELDLEWFTEFESSAAFTDGAWTELRASAGAYALGSLREDTRGARFRQRVRIRRPGGVEVPVVLENPMHEPARLRELVVQLVFE